MGRRPASVLVYAFAHFAVDLGCAYAMFSACGGGVAFLLYNFCAFALQMPLGLLADALGRNRRFALTGAALVTVICCLPSLGLLGAAALGLGNGLFHIGAGLDVLNLSADRAGPLGVFVSPGAFGIFLGALWGRGGLAVFPVLAALLLACGGMLLACGPDRLPQNAPLALPERRVLPWAALLFLVVALRSYGGLAASFPWKTGLWSLAAVTAVVLGKTLGGFLADRFGLLRSAAASLGLCAVLFGVSSSAFPGVLALLLFNMTMPMTLVCLARAMPGAKGFSFGLLTFALFLGYLPVWLGAGTIGGFGMAAVAALSAALLLPGLHKLSR